MAQATSPGGSLDPKARAILDAAAKVFSEKGYHNASMRDISRETGSSLAGMYYYFPSKERMLYSIQRFCFREVMDSLYARLEGSHDPYDGLRIFLHNHLSFFIDNVQAMKILSHESESLTGALWEEIAEMKREYFHALADVLRKIPDVEWTDTHVRRTVMAVFGMVNWIYTWYDPEKDGTVDELAETMYSLLRRGIDSPSRP